MEKNLILRLKKSGFFFFFWALVCLICLLIAGGITLEYLKGYNLISDFQLSFDPIYIVIGCTVLVIVSLGGMAKASS